jgi:hypothetical protein
MHKGKFNILIALSKAGHEKIKIADPVSAILFYYSSSLVLGTTYSGKDETL